jgi:hypothetical protein
MKTLITTAFLLINIFTVYAQKSITINVENLSRPTQLLPTSSYQNILESLILSDKKLSRTSLTNKTHQ